MSKRYTKYVILKTREGGYKGMFSELDTINEYSHEFDRILGEHGDDPKGTKQAILEFCEQFLPCEWSVEAGRYVSLFEEWVTGDVNLVSSMPEYEEWDVETKDEVRRRIKLWKRYLNYWTKHMPNKFKPRLAVTKGTNLLLPN